MNKLLITLIATFCALTISAQEKTDTIYYDSEWKVVASQDKADYFRIATFPEKDGDLISFEDYHITGEIQSRGHCLYMDPTDDSRTIVHGECTHYFKSGKVQYECDYQHGRLHGKYKIYDENGLILVYCTFRYGVLNGLYTKFEGDGTYTQSEFIDGEMKDDTYVVCNTDGYMVKMNNKDNTIIWESPAESEKKELTRAGYIWNTYNKNGIVVAEKSQKGSRYGKCHRIDIVILNKSLVPIAFDPSTDIIVAAQNKKGELIQQPIWSKETFLSKVTDARSMESNVGITSEQIERSYETATENFDAAAFQNQVIARQSMAQFKTATISEEDAKTINYLEPAVIQPGEAVSGFILTDRDGEKEIKVQIKIEGAKYRF